MKNRIRLLAGIPFLLCLSLLSSAQKITTIASGLGMPYSIAVDNRGFIYVAGSTDAVIYRVNSATGVKTVVAGTGRWGYSGDGGQATDAQLAAPSGIAVDAAGNLYFSDAAQYRIRKVTKATGIITTVAGNGHSGCTGDGGPATNASIGLVVGIAVDASGTIYFSEFEHHRVRMIGTDGKIHTVAGNGATAPLGDGNFATDASLQTPMGLSLDASGNVYIADMDHHRIRKISKATGKISTVAGNGKSAFGGDGERATGASLNYPAMVALDDSGNLLIADQYNHRVRKVTTSTGRIATLAGTGAASYPANAGTASTLPIQLPGGMAVYKGSLFVSETGAGSLLQITDTASRNALVNRSGRTGKADKAAQRNGGTGRQKRNEALEGTHHTSGSAKQVPFVASSGI